jgi:hypothetical protein
MKSLAGTKLSVGSRVKGVLRSRTSLEFILTLILAVQFQFNSRVGDDWPNSNVPHYVGWRYGEVTIATLWNEISYWITAWADGQGRFFPAAVIQAQLLFTFFQTQNSVRIVYSLVFVLFVLLWVSLIKRVSKIPATGTYFLIGLSFTMQFRRDFEPHIGFAQLVVWAAIWSCLSLHMLISALSSDSDTKRKAYSISAGIFFFISLCQYELSFFMLPIFYIITKSNIYIAKSEDSIVKNIISNKYKCLIPIATAASIYLSIVFGYLRQKATPDGSYVAGFDLVESPKAFLIQAYASIPTTGHSPIDTFKLPVNNFYFFVVLIMTAAYLLTFNRLLKLPNLINAYQQSLYVARYLYHQLLLFGICLISIPSIMISLQPSWWGKINFGGTYLGIVFGELGFAIIFAATLSYIEQKRRVVLKPKTSVIKKKIARPVGSVFANFGTFKFIVILLVFTTFLSNFRMIESTKNRDNISSSWTALTEERSFFNSLKNRDFLFSTTFNDAYEINVANVYKKTGIRLGQIFYPPYLWPDYLECQGPSTDLSVDEDFSTCPLRDIRQKSAATLANISRGTMGVKILTKEKGFPGDWPSILLKPGALDSSSFWYFNIFMITKTTALAYLVPMDSNPVNSLARPKEVTLYTLISNNSPRISPAFMGICLVEKINNRLKPQKVGGVEIVKWELPSVLKAPTGEVTFLEDTLDIRQITTGTC